MNWQDWKRHAKKRDPRICRIMHEIEIEIREQNRTLERGLIAWRLAARIVLLEDKLRESETA